MSPKIRGTDDGPTPVDYLLAGLAGCINVVGHVIAKEMGFELRGMDIQLEGDLNPARFMGKSKEQRAGYKEIRVKITPDSDADEATLEKWLGIVEDRCPVSDTLVNLHRKNIFGLINKGIWVQGAILLY